ncbi:MAG TPA: type I restriction enzyme HsdR N-terminal domain-containing protein [Bacteroidia bacterium]|nr:type I restriction enzyme HsdR N-terminal domain-containing protein [Bacteroidia bacterium]
MEQLNFPAYSFRLRDKQIFDPARKKFVSLTPEEWVRQHVIRYLAEDKQFPLSLMAVEAHLEINTLKKRIDILIYDRFAKPLLIVECKAPSVKINQDTFDQAARYNLKAGVDYFFITNGLNHFFCKADKASESYQFLKELPDYSLMRPA